VATKVPLELTIKAVDKATAPLRALTVRIHQLTAPLKNVKFFGQMKGLGEALNVGGLMKGFAGVGGALKSVGGEVFGLLGKLAGIGIVAGAAFFSIARGALEAGDKLGEVADRVGMTADQFASLQYAAGQADVDAESFTVSMDKLNKQLGEIKAGKGGEFLGFLQKVSPALAKQIKGSGSTTEAMTYLTEAFARINDPAKSAALATAAFGKSGAQMGRFLHGGMGALTDAQKRFFELNGSVEDFAKNASDLDNATKDNVLALEGLRNAIAGALFPALTALSKLVTEFIAQHREGLRKWAEGAAAAIQKWIADGGFERLTANLGKVAEFIGKVVDWLGPMGTAMAGVGILALPLIASLGSLGVAVVSLAIESIPLVVAAIGFMAPAFTAATAAVGTFGATAYALVAPMAAILLPLTALMMLGKAIYDNWDELGFLFKDWGNSLKWAVVDAWNAVKPILEKLAKIPGFGTPFALALATGDAILPQQATRNLGAQAAAPAMSGGQSTEARVSVDFSNMPKGARVSSDPTSSAPVSLDVGYSLAAP
jgi:hypothetical protein